MIRSYVGEDTGRARKEARSYFELERAENPAAIAAYFDDALFDFSAAVDVFTSESLFGGENILYFDGILDHPDGEVFYRTILKETAHTVIIREASPSKDLLAFFQRLGELKEYSVLKKFEKRVDSFAIVNALARRDKKASWVEFEKVRKAGSAMEEVHGTVFWGFKTMLIASVMDKQAAIRSGVKEPSYRTYSVLAKNYSILELKDKMSSLKDIYHKGHRGEGALEELLEEFILSN